MAWKYRFFAGAALALAAAPACSDPSSASGGLSPSLDAAAPFDGGSSGNDSGAEGVDASVCHAADLSSWSPSAYHPASGAAQGACTDADIQAVYDACFGASSGHDACGPIAAERCGKCVLTADTQMSYGPVVLHGSVATINFAGCVELEDASGGLACAKYVQAADACQVAACAANCPVSDSATLASYEACTESAAKGVCAGFESSASCLPSEADAGFGACDPSQPFEQAFANVARLFCGAPPMVDGGSAHD